MLEDHYPPKRTGEGNAVCIPCKSLMWVYSYYLALPLPSEDSAAAYMEGSLKTVAHAILSPYALYLYLYRCG